MGRKGWMLAGLLLVLLAGGCARWARDTGGDGELEQVAADLAGLLAGGEGSALWLGLRDANGEQTAATRLVDEYLVSALLRQGVELALADSAAEQWQAGQSLAPEQWQGVGAGRVVGGRLQSAPPWLYVRLFLVEVPGGQVLEAGTRRLRAGPVERLAMRRSREEGLVVEAALEVELHLLGLRSEGGMFRSVPIEAGGRLQQGDRLQIRFQVSRDCEVYAFLYSAEGEVREVFPGQYVYSGLPQYGPGEDQWVELNQSDQVYTLYVLAGPRLLEDNREQFFERLSELIEQGRVNRFEGVELFDQTLVEFLLRGLPGQPSLEVVRSAEGVELGEAETIVLTDGTRLSSQPENLRGAPLVLRAWSFEVQ